MICSFCGIADLFASSHPSSDDACLDVLWMVRLVMKAPVSVSCFSVELSHDSAIVLHNQYIKKGDLSVIFYLHSKLDGWLYVVDVLQKQTELFRSMRS